MKGEYLGEKQDHHHHHTNPNNMFAKLQQQTHQTFHHQPHQPTFHHPFHMATTTATAQNSEEADSLSPTTTSTTPITNTYNNNNNNNNNNKESSLNNNPSLSHDGASIEVVRRPRGRPPGSKNKAKPPVIITREPEPSMSPYVLELPPNVDIVESVYCFCNKRNMGLCIFNGTGSVTNVTLHQPSSTPGATVTFHGRFDILSISATILPNANNGRSNFTITLAGPQGQLFGGAVEGPLASAGTIFLMAATFNNPTYQRLPLLDDDEARNADGSGGGGGNEGQRHHSPPAVSGGGGSGDSGHHPVAGGVVSGGGDQMGMYNLASDVLWAPTARQPRNY